jgi:hypothetical protein
VQGGFGGFRRQPQTLPGGQFCGAQFGGSQLGQGAQAQPGGFLHGGGGGGGQLGAGGHLGAWGNLPPDGDLNARPAYGQGLQGVQGHPPQGGGHQFH